MQSKFLKISLIAGIFASIALSSLQSANAADLINVYLSAPKTTTTIFSDTTVETFESLTTGTYSSSYTSTIGTYQLSNTSKMAIIADNQYGSGTGKYMSFGAQSGTSGPITLIFNAPQSYFGFSWNAGDSNNGLSFYRGNELLGSYSTATILAKLSGTTVTAIDGSVYNSSQYKGQPVTGQNSSQPYAFINIMDTNGAFDRVVFTNNNTTGTGYETDNHTIRTTAPTADNSFVAVGSASAPAVPEAGTVTLLGLGLSAMGMLATRRKA